MFRFPTKGARFRDGCHLVLTAISFVDISITLHTGNGLLVCKFIRAVRISISFSQLRNALQRAFLVLWDSIGIVLLNMAYVIFSAWLGYCIFRGTPEGRMYFNDMESSIWNMLILSTADNFPTILLPAYKLNIAYTGFFILYLLFGYYFLMDLLLAVFYNSYRYHIEQSLNDFNETRSRYLQRKFNEFDRAGKGHLTQEECKELIEDLLSKYYQLDEPDVDIELFVKLMDKNDDFKITLDEFYNYFDVMIVLQAERNKVAKPSIKEAPYRRVLKSIVTHPLYDVISSISVILNLLSLMIRDLMEIEFAGRETLKVWINFQI